MVTTSEPTYIWEWGIDWHAVELAPGKSHLEQGLIRLLPAPEMTYPNVKQGETIRVRIFDLTDPPQETKIECLAIEPRLAEVGETNPDPPLSALPCTVTPCGSLSSRVFERPSGTSFPAWDSDEVAVSDAVLGNYLLKFRVEARKVADGPDDQSRTFGHDPEMIVGPNE